MEKLKPFSWPKYVKHYDGNDNLIREAINESRDKINEIIEYINGNLNEKET